MVLVTAGAAAFAFVLVMSVQIPIHGWGRVRGRDRGRLHGAGNHTHGTASATGGGPGHGFAFEIEAVGVVRRRGEAPRLGRTTTRCHNVLAAANGRARGSTDGSAQGSHSSTCASAEQKIVAHMNDACARHSNVFGDSKLHMLRSVLGFLDGHRPGGYVRTL